MYKPDRFMVEKPVRVLTKLFVQIPLFILK
jgi:hypothetical protein